MTVQFSVCGPKFMTFLDDLGDPYSSFQHTCPIIYRIFRSKDICFMRTSSYVAKSSKRVFWAPICTGRGYPRFRTYIFKSHSPSSLWSVLVEFRSPRLEGR